MTAKCFKQKLPVSPGSHFLGLGGFQKWGDFILGFSSQPTLVDTFIYLNEEFKLVRHGSPLISNKLTHLTWDWSGGRNRCFVGFQVPKAIHCQSKEKLLSPKLCLQVTKQYFQPIENISAGLSL